MSTRYLNIKLSLNAFIYILTSELIMVLAQLMSISVSRAEYFEIVLPAFMDKDQLLFYGIVVKPFEKQQVILSASFYPSGKNLCHSTIIEILFIGEKKKKKPIENSLSFQMARNFPLSFFYFFPLVKRKFELVMIQFWPANVCVCALNHFHSQSVHFNMLLFQYFVFAHFRIKCWI